MFEYLRHRSTALAAIKGVWLDPEPKRCSPLDEILDLNPNPVDFGTAGSWEDTPCFCDCKHTCNRHSKAQEVRGSQEHSIVDSHWNILTWLHTKTKQVAGASDKHNPRTKNAIPWGTVLPHHTKRDTGTPCPEKMLPLLARWLEEQSPTSMCATPRGSPPGQSGAPLSPVSRKEAPKSETSGAGEQNRERGQMLHDVTGSKAKLLAVGDSSTCCQYLHRPRHIGKKTLASAWCNSRP